MRTRAAGRQKRRARIDPRSFESVLTAFLDDLRACWYSKQLHKQARSVATRFLSHLTEVRVRDVRSVTEAHLVAYARKLSEQKTAKGTAYSFATQRSYLQMLRRLFRFLVGQGVILQDPTLDLVLPSWKKLPRHVPSESQARKLMAAPDPSRPLGKRDKAVLEVLYGSALRVGECERLDVGDLDLGKGTLFVRDGKGRKDRVVPVVGRAAAALDLYLKESRSELVRDPRERALFLTRFGTRLGIQVIQNLVRVHARAAGIQAPISPHSLRHGCATHLLQGGADIRHVQKLLGHSQVQTTAIYAQVAPTDLAKVVAKAHPRESRWRKQQAKQKR